MNSIKIAEFKSGCLKIIQKVHDTGIPVLVTKRNKPMAKVVPVQEEENVPDLKGSILYQDSDITSTGENWGANS